MPRGPRPHLRRRTRKALLRAAGELLKDGDTPTMADIAERAEVSRATAYRYFPTLEALLCEAPLDRSVPDPEQLFEGDRSRDPEARIACVERELHAVISASEASLRAMMAHSLKQSLERGGGPEVPVRQNRRTDLIRAALEPARRQFDKATYERLCAALALVLGTESMLVFRDVLGMSEPRARRVRKWAAQALVRTALRESGSREG